MEPTLLLNEGNIKFVTKGRTDIKYETNLETRKSVSGIEVSLNGTPVVMRSAGQKIVALSVKEAETIATTQGSQEMLHVMRLLESMVLHVKKPMYLESDDKGSIDVCNNWSINGRTKHMDVRYFFYES